jgi:hypothetical protein
MFAWGSLLARLRGCRDVEGETTECGVMAETVYRKRNWVGV